MTLAFSSAAAPRSARRWAVPAALAVALGLGGPAAWYAAGSASGPEPKVSVRLDAGPIEKRELAFFPRERAADDSLRSFKPGKAWAVEPPPAPLDMAPTPVAQDKPEAPARAKLAAAPRPPVRPASFAKVTPEHAAPRFADRPADRRVASGGGLHLPGFVPTGADVMKRIGGLGASMRDSIGSVGSSLGKLMRISSR